MVAFLIHKKAVLKNLNLYVADMWLISLHQVESPEFSVLRNFCENRRNEV